MATTIQFGKISYWNFMSFADQEWDFSRDGDIFLIAGQNHDLRVDDSGVCASNGSGKTNLVQGLMYCLYGQFPYKIHNNNIINKYSKKPDSENYVMKVTLDFSIVSDSSTQIYRIVRGVQKGSQGTVRLSLFEKDGIDWKDVSKSSSALTQQYIESLLCMNLQSFQRLVMLSFDPNFNFFRMSAAQKREFIQALFDTGVYTDMWELIKKDQNRFSLSLQGEKVRLNTLQNQLVNCEEEIKAYANTAREQEREINAEITQLSGDKLNANKDRQKDLTQQLEVLKATLQEIESRSTKYADIISKIRYRIYTAEQNIASLSRTIDSNKREINKHNDILGMVCDDCRTKIRSAYKLDEYEQAIRDSSSQVDVHNGEIAKLKSALNKTNDEVLKIQDEKNKISSQNNQLDSQLTGLQLEEREIETRIVSLTKRRDEIHDSISDPKKIPMMGTYKTTKAAIQACEKAISQVEEDISYLNLCEKVVSPDSIRKNIVSRVVSSINDLVNRYLDELNTTIRCEFDDQLDKYDIKAPQGWSIDYQNLSKGEQMKLLLATQLAFRKFLLLRLNTTCNCFILDEIVDQNFDTLSISRILDVLLDMSTKENTHIYIISHRGEVSHLTDDLVEANPSLGAAVHRILIEKTNNISTISLLN